MSRQEDINPGDPLFLISRALDGDLGSAEKVRLDALLAESDELQGQADAYRRVNSLLTAWREDEARIDWPSYEKLILARLEESEEEAGSLDQLLNTWGRRQPGWDESRFTGEVLSRISAPSTRAMPWWKVVRLGAPIAAAAAIVIALTATSQSPQPAIPLAPVAVVEIGRSEYRPTETAVSVVTFARTASRSLPAEETVSFGYMTLGSSPIAQTEEAPL